MTEESYVSMSSRSYKHKQQTERSGLVQRTQGRQLKGKRMSCSTEQDHIYSTIRAKSRRSPRSMHTC